MSVQPLEAAEEAAVLVGDPAGAPEDRATLRAWLWLALLVVVTLSSSLCVYCVDGLVDPIKRSLKISDVQMSLVLGWSYVGPFAVCVLPMGWLSDRAPRRLMLMGGAAVFATGTVCCAFAPNLPILCLSRAIVGMGVATVAPCAISILASLFPSRMRARVFGISYAASGVGPGIGLTASGFGLSLAEHLQGAGGEAWRLAILMCAAPALVAITGLILTPEAPRRAVVSGAKPIGGDKGFWGILLLALLAVASVTLSDGAQLSWSTAALSREHGMSPAEAARLAGYIFIFCGAGAPLIAGVLADGFHRRWGVPGRLSVAILAVAALVPLQFFFSIPATTSVLIVMVCAGFCVVTGEVVGAAVLQDLVPENRRGLAAAANGLCGSSAIAIGTTSVAMIAQSRAGSAHATTEAMSLATAPASIAALLIFIALWWVVRRAGTLSRTAAAAA